MGKRKVPEKLDAAAIGEVAGILAKESDLAAVLIGTSFLDLCLENLLRSKFRKDCTTVDELLNPNEGILGNIAGRAKIAYCLDLISKSDYQDLLAILEIRNLFAHKHRILNFNDEDVVSRCDKLQVLIPPDIEEIYGRSKGASLPQ